jgi:hypothetical protein
MWTWLVWLRIGTGGELLWNRYWTLGSHKMLGNYRVSKQLGICRVVLSPMELVISVHISRNDYNIWGPWLSDLPNPCSRTMSQDLTRLWQKWASGFLLWVNRRVTNSQPPACRLCTKNVVFSMSLNPIGLYGPLLLLLLSAGMVMCSDVGIFSSVTFCKTLDFLLLYYYYYYMFIFLIFICMYRTLLLSLLLLFLLLFNFVLPLLPLYLPN